VSDVDEIAATDVCDTGVVEDLDELGDPEDKGIVVCMEVFVVCREVFGPRLVEDLLVEDLLVATLCVFETRRAAEDLWCFPVF